MGLELILIELAQRFPALLGVFAAIGVLRAVFKPLMAFLRVVADATPTEKDNEVLDGFVQSGLYKGIAFVVDYLTSIKLPGVK